MKHSVMTKVTDVVFVFYKKLLKEEIKQISKRIA